MALMLVSHNPRPPRSARSMTDRLSPDASPGALRFRRAFLLILAGGISLLFFLVIQGFLLAVLLAAVFAGLASPIYRWLQARVGRRLAGAATVLLLLAGLGLPAAGFLTLVATEAVQVSQAAELWFREDGRMAQIQALVDRIPFADRLFPEGALVAEQLRDAASRTGPFLMGALAAATRGTLTFFLQAFVLLYALYYFLVDGPSILRGIVRYLPLAPEQKEELPPRFLGDRHGGAVHPSGHRLRHHLGAGGHLPLHRGKGRSGIRAPRLVRDRR
jgi:predicted PurR-regulated permease PerM